MKGKKVKEIILPLKEGVQTHPSVTMGDKIISAIELMLKNNLKDIAVVHNGRPIGMVCLEDAFQVLGLRVPPHR
ncbi:MAG: CBS domain-containing protein [Deltaproteobacteria bacterium]|nr:CBS domain-containing protein [Deltaproteobacteria bacterium]